MYMYINLKLWRQKWSTNLGVKNVFFQKSRLITISMVFLPKSPTPHRFMHVGDTENKENNGMCVSFSICRDNRMRKHISCSVDFMSHRKYNTYINTQKSFCKKELSKAMQSKIPLKLIYYISLSNAVFQVCRSFWMLSFPWKFIMQVHRSDLPYWSS